MRRNGGGAATSTASRSLGGDRGPSTAINALKSIDYTGPDWTIRELFYHIMPDGLTEVVNHQKVGLDVMDKLAAGQLTAWGRRVRGRPLQQTSLDFHGEELTSHDRLANQPFSSPFASEL
jgi:hypothetical protein